LLFVLSKSQEPKEMDEHKQQLEEHQDNEGELSARFPNTHREG
jgi:hypothetical protein